MAEPLAPIDDVFHQMSVETMCCYWCEREAEGTARDLNGVMRLTCGQVGHGKA